MALLLHHVLTTTKSFPIISIRQTQRQQKQYHRRLQLLHYSSTTTSTSRIRLWWWRCGCLGHHPQPSTFGILPPNNFLCHSTTQRKLDLCLRSTTRSSTGITSTPPDSRCQQQDSTNPTLEWKGSSHSSSDFCTHVIVSKEDYPEGLPVTAQYVIDHMLDQVRNHHTEIEVATDASAMTLISLGSVWYLPRDAPRDPAQGGKPIRLQDGAMLLEEGDYLRIHQNPRRFPEVHKYNWTAYKYKDQTTANNNNNNSNTDDEKPGVIIAANDEKGWLVIDKPAMVPVHMTVDNSQENVASCLLQARQRQHQTQQTSGSINDDDEDVYVTTPQRLDQNTSGLFVVATSKLFAAYYAKLLRTKTETLLLLPNNDRTTTNDDDNKNMTITSITNTMENNRTTVVGGVHKLYRCLVCLMPPKDDDDDKASSSPSWSIRQAASQLQSYAETRMVMRHYLEPSIRAPKRFVTELPPTLDDNNSTETQSWLECLLRITKVSKVYPLVGNRVAEELGEQLWNDNPMITNDDDENNNNNNNKRKQYIRKPPKCQAVMELEIELLTGRTHQIRGQLSAFGFPLVGDAQYGGAIPQTEPIKGVDLFYVNTERLALQCCELEFLDPDIVVTTTKSKRRKRNEEQITEEVVTLKRSNRWNKFRLEEAWWTQLLGQYDNEAATNLSEEEKTTSASDTASSVDPTEKELDFSKRPRPDLLPERVQLSPGRNKYVLVKAKHPLDDNIEWFVKSAKPNECGGAYHGNVAQDLREWIEAAGYEATVTGGGRIDYKPAENLAVVYGFSYGFGKADHAKAASIIHKWSKGTIQAFHDNAEGLY